MGVLLFCELFCELFLVITLPPWLIGRRYPGIRSFGVKTTASRVVYRQTKAWVLACKEVLHAASASEAPT